MENFLRSFVLVITVSANVFSQTELRSNLNEEVLHHNSQTAVNNERFKGIASLQTELTPTNYLMDVNNVLLPVGPNGILADVNILLPNDSTHFGGEFLGDPFLYSGGFLMAGKDQSGTIWANGVASALRIQDYIAGPLDIDPSTWNERIYGVSADDEPFGTSWELWTIPVQYGAWYYDGDNDGMYDPVDKNGNNEWDPDEDKPLDQVCRRP